MDIIEEFLHEIIFISHFHDEEGKVTTLLANSSDAFYAYKEETLLLYANTYSKLFPLIALFYKENKCLLPKEKLCQYGLDKFEKLFMMDKQSFIGIANNKLMKLPKEFYSQICSKNDFNIFDAVFQSSDCQDEVCHVVKVERGEDTAQSSLFTFIFEDSLYLSLFSFANFVKKSIIYLVFGVGGQVWFIDSVESMELKFLYLLDSACISTKVVIDSKSVASFVCETASEERVFFSAKNCNEYTVTKSWMPLSSKKNLPNLCLSFLEEDCCNRLQACGRHFLKENFIERTDDVEIKDIEAELQKLKLNIEIVQEELEKKQTKLTFHTKVCSSKLSNPKSCLDDRKKLLFDMSQTFLSNRPNVFFLHALCLEEGCLSTSLTSSQNVLDLSFTATIIPCKPILMCTIEDYALPFSSKAFDLKEMVLVSNQKAYLGEVRKSFTKKILINKSFLIKFKDLKEFLFGPLCKAFGHQFFIQLFEHEVLLAIKSVPGQHQLWVFSSDSLNFLNYLFNSYLKKIDSLLV